MMTATPLHEITLRGVLPRVFARGEAPAAPREDGGLWRTPEARLSCSRRWLVEAESGAGKSSLCAYLCGLRDDYEGTILFDGADIRTFDTARWTQLRRTTLAYLPQDMMLFPELTARENVELKNSLTGWKTPAQIDDMLLELGLEGRLDTPARLMSVGQQQRVAIVRALCQPFAVVLLDEPVSHLDPHHNALAARLIEREASAQGAGVISTSVGNPLTLPDATLLKL